MLRIGRIRRIDVARGDDARDDVDPMDRPVISDLAGEETAEGGEQAVDWMPGPGWVKAPDCAQAC